MKCSLNTWTSHYKLVWNVETKAQGICLRHFTHKLSGKLMMKEKEPQNHGRHTMKRTLSQVDPARCCQADPARHCQADPARRSGFTKAVFFIMMPILNATISTTSSRHLHAQQRKWKSYMRSDHRSEQRPPLMATLFPSVPQDPAWPNFYPLHNGSPPF